jgi:Protein of unknown function (DUF3761)
MKHVLWSLALMSCAMLGQHSYRAADGTWVRRPHMYRRHPNTGTVTTAVCKDGRTSFAHPRSRSGTCSHHGGVKEWK